MELRIIGTRDVEKAHVDNFPAWFVKKAFELRQQGAPEMTDELFALATGSMPTALSYSACAVNGVKYVCRERDANRKTQNSGVFVPGSEATPFYGVLEEVLVIQYVYGCNAIIMRCKWYDTDSRKKRLKVVNNITSIYVNAEWYKDDPFILSTQAHQVFYTEDLMNGPHWRVAHIFDPRNVWDLPSDSEPVSEDVETYSGQFELVVDLPPLENIEYHRSEAQPVPVLDDNVISLVETDEEFNDDDDIDDTQANYLDEEEEAEFDDYSSDNTDDDTDHNSDTHNNSDTSDND